MIAVVDSSAFVTLFTSNHDDLDPRLTSRLTQLTLPHVPDVVDVEFHHALRGLLLGGKIGVERADLARELFSLTPKRRVPTHPLSDRIWELRDNLGAYDACFLALAESLEAPLVTCDSKQASASGHHASVEVFDPAEWRKL
ncbi:MAG: type II toxin-antitoxin system VapC family toxin [Stackebrandtia sp.]